MKRLTLAITAIALVLGLAPAPAQAMMCAPGFEIFCTVIYKGCVAATKLTKGDPRACQLG